MRKFFPTLLVCIMLLLFSKVSVAQGEPVYDYVVERDQLLTLLKKKHVSDEYSRRIQNFYFKSCDSLIKKKIVINNRPIKTILIRLFDASEEKINKHDISMLRMPSLNNNFLMALRTSKKDPVKNLYSIIGPTQSSILESAFDGTPIGDSLRIYVGIGEMINTPNYVITRINKPIYAAYQDTLLYILANNAPDILIKKLAENDPLFTALVAKSDHKVVKAVSQIKMDNSNDKVIPFCLAIYEKRVTEEDIKKLSLLPADYYRAFIEETIRLHNSPDPEINSFLRTPVITINYKLADQYYIGEINLQHELPDKERFKTLNQLKARELYFLLIDGSNQLYTSSFLYVFKKFLNETEKEGLDKFFEDINYYQFDQLLSNVSGYKLVDSLISHLSEEKAGRLMGKYLNTLLNKQLSDNDVILKAMVMSEIFYEIRNKPVLKTILVNQLEQMEKRPEISNYMMYKRMTSGLKDILQDKNIYAADHVYDVLPIQRLQKNNTIVQACFFYDDEDAETTFSNSVATYDAKQWDKKDMGNYIVFNSKGGNNMRVYMNKPTTKQGCDSSQDEMLRAIAQEGYEVTSFIHRGHSYHLFQSLRKISSSGQLVFLGSCGGYNEVLKIFELNPDVNIITTRNIGSKQINDPLLARINADIVNNKDINWNSMWQDFDTQFQSKATKDLFSSYVAPNQYIGVKFMRRVFDL